MAADQIQSTAKTLASVGFMADFVEYFYLNYLRGNAENDLTTIAGRTAQLLLDLFKKVAANTGKSKQVNGGAKVQVTGHRSGHRPQVKGHRSGHRLQVTGHTVKFQN